MRLEIVKSAMKNLNRRRARSALMASGVIIGVCAVVVIMCMGRGAREYVMGELESLGVNGLNIYAKSGAGAEYRLTLDDVRAVTEKVPAVRSAMPLMVGYGASYMRGARQETVIWGVSEAMPDIMDVQLLHGSLFSRADISRGELVCIISDKQALDAYRRTNVVGKELRVLLGDAYHVFRVAGVIRSQSASLDALVGGYIPSFVYIPATTMQNLTGRSDIDQIMVAVADGADMDEAGEAITRMLGRGRSAEGVYLAENLVSQGERISGVLEVMTLIISAIAAVSLIVGGIGIMTLMLVTVGERVREIGIKKAVGATRGCIMFEYLMEAVILTLFGGGVGSLIGAVASSFVSGALGISYKLDASILFISISFCVTLGIAFGVYPASKAARLDPIDALRRE